MKNKTRFLIPLIIVLAIAGLVTYRYYVTRTHWNDSYVNGNTAGNLYNSGLFCEYDNMVYFSNPSDNYYLYSMNTRSGETKKLQEDVVSFINADENYVYYVRNNAGKSNDTFVLNINNNSLCRYDLKTGDVLVLDPEPSHYASLIGNYIYYIHYDTDDASSLYRVKIDGTDKEQVDRNPYFTCSANGQYFYYNGLENDHNIYQMDTTTNNSDLICEGNYWMPSADNENIYFLDCEQNYALVKLGRTEAAPATLTTDRIECYNVYGDTIYFQRNNLDNTAALCSMNTDGSNYQVIMEGNYTNINVTSQYVYFRAANNANTIYMTPTNGDGSVAIFQP